MGGMVLGLKIAGALAEEGKSRDEVAEMTRKTTALTKTLAVAMKPCTHPQTGQPLFELADYELVIGPGVHGEAGPEGPMKLATACGRPRKTKLPCSSPLRSFLVSSPRRLSARCCWPLRYSLTSFSTVLLRYWLKICSLR